MRVKTFTPRCRYWRPGFNHLEEVLNAIQGKAQNGDILLISEKPLATALGRLVDEAEINPSSLARLLAWFTRHGWGGPLGVALGFKPGTLRNLRSYPPQYCAAHKQLSLSTAGLLQSLRHYSEGGIDASNLPGALVALPLENPSQVAREIRGFIQRKLGASLTVVIVDGDATYSWRNLHLAPRPVETPGLVHLGGALTLVLGRLFRLRARPTPIAICGESLNPDRALWLARLHHKLAGGGAGRTVWSMSQRLGTGLTGVTWEMLEAFEHRPLTLARILE